MTRLQRSEARRDLAQFVSERRHRTKPQDVGLPAGGRRRTPGLRREEVAQLVGVSVTWYTWFEQGRDIQVSARFLERISDAFRLNDDERATLFSLANQTPPAPHPPPVPIAPQMPDRVRSALVPNGKRPGQNLVTLRSPTDLETQRISQALQKVLAGEHARPALPAPPAEPVPAAASRSGIRWSIGMTLVGMIMLIPY